MKTQKRENAEDADWRLGYRPALDGLRGVAILMVLAWHLGIPGLEGAGQAGVTLFFVLSGFLITAILVEEHGRRGRIDLARFYLRRAARLFPALLVLLFFASFAVLLEHPSSGPIVILAPLFYVANWAQAAHVDMSPVDHTWTLSIEEQFYLTWPLLLSALLVIRRRWALYAVLALLVASTALRYYIAPLDSARALWGTDVRADALLAGCGVALVLTRWPVRIPPTAVAIALVAFLLVSIVGSPPVMLAGGLTIITAASAAFIMLLATTGGSALTWRWLRWVGSLSYGLYLWHPFLFSTFSTIPHIALVVPAFLAAMASARWIERPIISWVKGRSRAVALPLPASVQ